MAATKKVKKKSAGALLATYRKKRDFKKTREPRGAPAANSGKALRLIVQKHDATNLHFDLRLELDGVMKSWAVPKGPSNDPADKRLAMQVEDHPIEYNKFEGTIPKGEYGGGTVMLWDVGTYKPLDGTVKELRAGFKSGSIKIIAHGERMKGEWALVRMGGARNDGRQWLLIKHRDQYARAGGNLVARNVKSVTTGRTMREIAKEGSPSAQEDDLRSSSRARAKAAASLQPMLAKTGTEIPEGRDWAFEPKYDGIRILGYADGSAVQLMTRNNLDKSDQFPEVAEALAALSKKKRRSFVIDGEIVALRGRSLGRFQELSSRIHQKDATKIAGNTENAPAALVTFDLLLDGPVSYVNEPYTARRKALVRLLAGMRTRSLRLGVSESNGKALLGRALKDGWEGVMAKRTGSVYQLAVRSPDWLKLKLEARQEFVVGGWTEPRNSREHLGAILLGLWKRGKFVYAGHTGGGFTRVTLKEMMALLKPLETAKSPFSPVPKTNAKAHWTKPKVVVEIKFNEWTTDGSLRQPIFLGVRDDKAARTVKREGASVQRLARRVRPVARSK